MEAPTKADGPEAGESIRNAKVQVLNSIPPITIDECFLGQYEGKWIVHNITISN
jgi:glucose-6-phosphate 1-dehydrogenase